MEADRAESPPDHNPRLRVLFVTPMYPGDAGMAGTFVHQQVLAVSKLHQVRVVHIGVARHGVRALRGVDVAKQDGVDVERAWHRWPVAPRTRYLAFVWSGYRAVADALRTFGADILHAHTFQAAFPAVVAARGRTPVITTEHFSTFLRRSLHWYEVAMARYAFERSCQVLPVSRALEAAIRSYGIRLQSTTVPNVVDTGVFFPRPPGRGRDSHARVLFVGNLAEVKGVDLLLHALRGAFDEGYRDWDLDLIGDGNERESYERLSAQLSLAGKVHFHGRMTGKQVAEWMSRADFLVVPSRAETFSVAAAEALTCGTPVLSTRCGGPEEFITKENGLLVAPDSEMALQKGLIQMLSGHAAVHREEIARAARAMFDPEVIARRLDSLYRACLEQDHGTGRPAA